MNKLDTSSISVQFDQVSKTSRGGHGSGGSGLGEFYQPTRMSRVWRYVIRWPSIEVVRSDESSWAGRVWAGDKVYNTQPQQYNIHHHSPTKSKYTNQIKIYQPNQSKKSHKHNNTYQKITVKKSKKGSMAFSS